LTVKFIKFPHKIIYDNKGYNKLSYVDYIKFVLYKSTKPKLVILEQEDIDTEYKIRSSVPKNIVNGISYENEFL
jgi:hypothetical protein